eukprot:3093225-Pyramimonas_sp.AAC.1
MFCHFPFQNPHVGGRARPKQDLSEARAEVLDLHWTPSPGARSTPGAQRTSKKSVQNAER